MQCDTAFYYIHNTLIWQYLKNELFHILQTLSPKASYEGHVSLKKIPSNDELI